jgi:hypothetical protein
MIYNDKVGAEGAKIPETILPAAIVFIKGAYL